MASRFCQYQLRTTDVGAARAFYTELLGGEVWCEHVTVVPLPERAAQRGAPAHWLGRIGVDDVEASLRRFSALRAEQLGPLERDASGASHVVLRDPDGAVVALGSPSSAPRSEPVAWHQLHAHDEAQAFAGYAKLCGWAPTEAFDLGPELGKQQWFAWAAGGGTVGSVANTLSVRLVHPQWLFFFRVASLDSSLAQVRAHGGVTLSTVQLSNGARLAPCDDPQGAAFGLFQASSPAAG